MVVAHAPSSVVLDAIEVLERIRALLDSPDKWIKVAYAINNKGVYCSPHDADAVKYCLSGAFWKVGNGFIFEFVNHWGGSFPGDTMIKYRKHVYDVQDVINNVLQQVAGADSLISYNDREGVGYDDMITTLDRCIDVLADEQIAKVLPDD